MVSPVWCFRSLCLILIASLRPCSAAPHTLDLSSFSLPSLPAMPTSFNDAVSRMATYGYQMLGYAPPEPSHYHEHYDIKDKKALWDGHIGVPDFVSPLIASVPDMSYGEERVVKGHDGRLGFRLAVPYFGDLQYIREYGPGRFTDHLGPGKYPYPGLDGRPKKEDDHHYAPAPTYGVPHKKEVYPPHMYQGLNNYPWNV